MFCEEHVCPPVLLHHHYHQPTQNPSVYHDGRMLVSTLCMSNACTECMMLLRLCCVQQDYGRCVWPTAEPHGGIEVAQLLDSWNELRLEHDPLPGATHSTQRNGPGVQSDAGDGVTASSTRSSQEQSSVSIHGMLTEDGVGGGGVSSSDCDGGHHSTIGCATTSSATNGSSSNSSSNGRALHSPLQVISMSHFLPSQQLLPEKRFLMWPNLVCHVA